MTQGHKNSIRKGFFVSLFLLAALPFVSSPAALLVGFCFSLLFGNPLPERTAWASKNLLKLSVIGLGFGIDFSHMIDVGASSIVLTLVSITATVCLGELLGRAFNVAPNTRKLLSFGTAICGGSAIAAMAPVIKAKDEEVAVSLATVFTLNAVALVLFPPLGHFFKLSQEQFGLWSALAIHDTSSVAGAAATFGAVALSIATTVKLTRALWIAPCTLVASVLLKSDKRTGIPPFIIAFIAAAFINSWLPDLDFLWNGFYLASKQGLVMTLFLIGAGLTRTVLRQVGIKPLLLGTALWVAVSGSALVLILKGVIS